MKGWPLYLAICVLGAMPLVDRTLGAIAVGVLLALQLLVIRQARVGERA